VSPREYEIEAEDGCTWSLSWFKDASAFFVDVWGWAPDEETGGSADPDPSCTCLSRHSASTTPSRPSN
jgi:hypothetical protein